MNVVERANGVREVNLITSVIPLVGNGMGMQKECTEGQVQVAFEDSNKMNHGQGTYGFLWDEMGLV